MKFTLEQLQKLTGGKLLQKGPRSFDRFGIDSRTIPKGALFFALPGENTDGHLFVADACRHGAGGAIVEHPLDPPARGFLILQVKNSMKALHKLAGAARQAQSGAFVGLTGSCGKTSTKEFTAALLSKKYSVFKSEGNLNSLTGLPLSLLELDEQQDCSVLEIGMNHPGEIAQLTKVLKPSVAMVLNVNPVHLGHFSSLEAIADEKFSMLSEMPSRSTGIFNADDPLLAKRAASLKNPHFSFGFSKDADLVIENLQELGVRGIEGSLRWKGTSIPFKTQLCGKSNAQNIAAAALCALILDVPSEQISAAIEDLKPYKQRGRLVDYHGITIYDDTYNSNPAALSYALQIIANTQGFQRKVAILGDMFELGPDEKQFHEQAGAEVAANRLDVLIATGEKSRSMAEKARESGVPEVHWVEDSAAAGAKAKEILKPGDLVLIKGSRGMKMEKALDAIVKNK